MNDYETLKGFWDETFKGYEAKAVNSKWVESDKFNDIIETYINQDSIVLDYGCGSGWAIFEASNTVRFKRGYGIDTSISAIELNRKTAELSNMDNLEFLAGDETILKSIKEKIDFSMSINVLDVLPDEVIDSILDSLSESMKIGGTIFIGLNHDFKEEELLGLLKMEKEGHYFYRNGVMRCNKKTIDEWIEILSRKFNVLEQFEFCLVEREKNYPRVGFLLKK